MTERSSYSGLQIGLHWLVALLVSAAWFTGEGMGRALHQKLDGTDPGFQIHVAIGLAVAATVVVRILTRVSSGTPGPLPEATGKEAQIRHWGHLLLYVLMIVVPLGGIVTWFVGVEALGDVHALAGNVLFYVAGAHAAISLFHHYVKKDDTLRRMLRTS